jgi:hypothetical protein
MPCDVLLRSGTREFVHHIPGRANRFGGFYLFTFPPPLPADLLKQKAPDALQTFKSRKKKWLFTGRGDVHF